MNDAQYKRVVRELRNDSDVEDRLFAAISMQRETIDAKDQTIQKQRESLEAHALTVRKRNEQLASLQQAVYAQARR
jgi:hypothetical protein